MQFSVIVETRLREGIADPEGHTIERSLPALGFDGISEVRVGKVFRFLLDAQDEDEARSHAEQVTRSFLVNPVIEDAEVTVTSGVPA